MLQGCAKPIRPVLLGGGKDSKTTLSAIMCHNRGQTCRHVTVKATMAIITKTTHI